jgi:hypothetical protein
MSRDAAPRSVALRELTDEVAALMQSRDASWQRGTKWIDARLQRLPSDPWLPSDDDSGDDNE